MRFFIKNFGCRLNQFEGDAIFEMLIRAGLVPGNATDSDLIIVNGCTVTSRADQKVRQFIHKIMRNNPNARIILTSCTAEAIRKGILKGINGVEVVGWENKFSIDKYILGTPEPSHDRFPRISRKSVSRTRAWVKIQDGCNRRCAFCIVPVVRGRSVSRSSRDIIDQIRELNVSGFAEIVLTGVDIGNWSDGKAGLAQLVEKILSSTDVKVLRLSSLEPPGLTDELIEVFCTNERIAPHLHIPIQSGSERVLKLMNRDWYKLDELVGRIEKVINCRDGVCIGTDIIVGFPGENDEDFEATERLLRSGYFAYAHIFKFSPRPMTPAYNLKPIPPKTVNERAKRIKEIDRNNRMSFAKKFVGKILDFIPERVTEERVFGHSLNYLKVVAQGSAKRGEISKVLVEDFAEMTVFGKVLSDVK